MIRNGDKLHIIKFCNMYLCYHIVSIFNNVIILKNKSDNFCIHVSDLLFCFFMLMINF